MVNQFGLSKSTIVFKIWNVTVLKNYPKIKKSSVFLQFLKNNFKVIKDICKENAREFK